MTTESDESGTRVRCVHQWSRDANAYCVECGEAKPTDESSGDIRDPNEPITVVVTRAQAWDIYDLTVAKAVTLEAVEDANCVSLPGARRYREAAAAIRKVLA